MITIVKGNEKIVCSKNTFEDQYKRLGYRIASNKKEATSKVASLLKEDKKENQEKTLEEIKQEAKEEEKVSEKYGLTSSKKTVSKKGK